MKIFSGQKIPLASKMLLHKKGRLILSLLGIAFSVVIMFMEIGFFNGINDSQANLPPLINADLLIMHHRRYSMLETVTIPRLRLSQVAVLDEVAEAIPFYEGMDTMFNKQEKRIRAISILAFPQDTASPLLVDGLEKYQEQLKISGNVLYDRLSRDIYGGIKTGDEIMLGGRRLNVIGTVKIGPNIKLDGYVVMGEATWVNHTGVADKINLGLIRLKPGADIKAVKQKMRDILPADTIFMTPEEARKREVMFTIESTPTGSVFGIGVIIGFIIGVIICYQILFNEITDHLPQYATMKAVGFSKKFLVSLVMKQSVLLSVLGFVPGLIGGGILYFIIQHSTRILMFMTPLRIIFVFVLTVLMCVVASIFAMKKVLKADPADLY
jgi:putative ABC transport system permease protein